MCWLSIWAGLQRIIHVQDLGYVFAVVVVAEIGEK